MDPADAQKAIAGAQEAGQSADALQAGLRRCEESAQILRSLSEKHAMGLAGGLLLIDHAGELRRSLLAHRAGPVTELRNSLDHLGQFIDRLDDHGTLPPGAGRAIARHLGVADADNRRIAWELQFAATTVQTLAAAILSELPASDIRPRIESVTNSIAIARRAAWHLAEELPDLTRAVASAVAPPASCAGADALTIPRTRRDHAHPSPARGEQHGIGR